MAEARIIALLAPKEADKLRDAERERERRIAGADWVKDIIEGPQGMNSFQRHEMVIWNEPERIAAANWVLRCLANPSCEGSGQMLHAILERRKNAMRSQNRRG